MMKVSHSPTESVFSTDRRAGSFRKRRLPGLFLMFLLLAVAAFPQDTDFQFNDKNIQTVIFSGNQFFNDRRLRDMMSTVSSGLFRKRRTFNNRILKRDLEEIERNYQAEGFLHCSVSDSLALNEQERVEVYIFIEEGPRFHVKEFSVEGNTLVEDRKIRSLLNIEEGEPFKPFEYQQGLQQVQDEYGKRGRPFVSLVDHISEDVEMSILVKIDEDAVYHINSINVTGHEDVEEKTIRREISVKPGDVFDLEDIRKSRLHIFELGPFNSVNIQPVNRNPDSLTVDLRVRVSESLPRRWDANIGIRQGRISEINQTYLFTQVDWLHKNLFNKARRFQMKGNFGIVWDQESFFRKSSPSYGLDLSYTRPRLITLRLPTTFKIYYNKDVYSPFARNIDENDELVTAGFEISSMWKLERKLYSLTSFSLRSVESILSDEKSEIQRRIAGQLRYDNRDNFLFPRKGWNASADLQVVKGISGSPTDYFQWNVSVSRYQALWEHFVLAFRMETGMVHNRTDRPPLLVMYRMGTETTVRGWSQSIGRAFKTSEGLTIYADYAKILGNIECRISLPWNLGLELFIDAGQLDSEFHRLWDKDQLYISAGPGLTYATFIGPIRLEFPFVLQDPSGRYKRWEQPERHFIIALLFAF